MTDFDFGHVYDGLKDFQVATVEHVTDRFYGADPTDRFLVADEVGLGKTLVARGVIARSIEHHLEVGTDRIDVVYICSNADIASQNVRRLNVLERNDFNLATRITLLPRILTDLQSNRINFVSFTPGTSFNLKSSEGIVGERVLLYHMLRDLWGSGVVRNHGNDKRVFAGGAGFDNFYGYLDNWSRYSTYDETLAGQFADQLDAHDEKSRRAGRTTLQERFEELRERFLGIHENSSETVPGDLRSDRASFIGQLRELLARTCVEALEPDLVILDEFQRFKHLFDEDNPAGELAQQLFGYPEVKVLLLSATPYKMYTLSDEADEDHYADFLDTLAFLMAGDQVAGFRGHLRTYRRALFNLHDGGVQTALEAKGNIEAALREVMSRTERLAVTDDRSGMLYEPPVRNLTLTTDDIRQYLAFDEVSQRLDAGGALHYWKSTPYPLTFMDGYKVDRELERAVEAGDRAWLTPHLGRPGMKLDWRDLESYEAVDPGNVRMRVLLRDVVECGAWRLLWIPPSLPYYELGGPFSDLDLRGFTKRLIFSSWTVVPKVIGAMVSYEAERRMLRARGEPVRNTPAFRRKHAELLRFQRSAGRLTGMPVFALLHPSPALAELCDPRALAEEVASHDQPASQEVMLRLARGRVEERLHPHAQAAPTDGNVDERWYWAAPLLLDLERDREGTLGWFESHEEVAGHFVRNDPETEADKRAGSGLRDHVGEAAAFVRDELEDLGRVPPDLYDVVAEMGLAGPGVSALRALARINPTADGVADETTREHASFVAWSVRHLFNLMDATYLLRSEATGSHPEDAYWRLVLRYCLDGCLQAVLDEYVHMVREWQGVTGVEGNALLQPVTEAIHEALTLRTVNYRVRDLQATDDGVTMSKPGMRGLFALRFGDERSEDASSVQRSSSVRAAFNSPFRPFVLATTSVGQEGLDFHTYCHAVVHWNLPSNPVDLEQREGRVHRYKGHAVRKNIADDHRAAALGREPDPWEAIFEAASRSRREEDNELVPFWLYPKEDGAKIERYVPALPLSRGSRKLKQLKRSLAAYRLVFGQPRQEDLVAFLQENVDDDDLRQLLDDLQIDLTPARASS